MKNVSQKDKDKALKDLDKIRRDNLRKLGYRVDVLDEVYKTENP